MLDKITRMLKNFTLHDLFTINYYLEQVFKHFTLQNLFSFEVIN